MTAKDFRTWAGTVLTYRALRALQPGETEREARRNVVEAIRQTSERLGNTPAVARRSYVHPAILQAYLDGDIGDALVEAAEEQAAPPAGTTPRRRPGSWTCCASGSRWTPAAADASGPHAIPPHASRESKTPHEPGGDRIVRREARGRPRHRRVRGVDMQRICSAIESTEPSRTDRPPGLASGITAALHGPAWPGPWIRPCVGLGPGVVRGVVDLVARVVDGVLARRRRGCRGSC